MIVFIVIPFRVLGSQVLVVLSYRRILWSLLLEQVRNWVQFLCRLVQSQSSCWAQVLAVVCLVLWGSQQLQLVFLVCDQMPQYLIPHPLQCGIGQHLEVLTDSIV
jgi:hypothetical protein